MARSSLARLASLTAALLVTVVSASSLAQDRSSSGRARMELSFDHGAALALTTVTDHDGSTRYSADGLALAADLRLYAPEGFGVIVRTGYEGLLTSGAFGVDVGAAYRANLADSPHAGVQLVFSTGGSAGYGFLRRSSSNSSGSLYGAFGVSGGSEGTTLGGVWGSVHLDFWFRNSFVGVGVLTRAQWTERHDGALVSFVPAIRVGGDWGL